ncbi:MAG: carotenoid oxygenase family protein [Actinobacteria bacterium]|nr:carotenoid oxygenase family protein [Actinomycetota bacterium]
MAKRHPLTHHLLSRRMLLAMMGGAGATAMVNACARPDAAATGAGATSPRPLLGAAGSVPAPGVEPFDAARPYWLQGNFAPVTDEVELTDLRVRGTLPADLDGLFLRNGSNPATGRSPHWFLGDGMVHAVRIEKGQARWYRNRFVQTPMYQQRAEMLGSGAPGQANNQSNVSVFEHAGAVLTSGEVGWPYKLDPADLSTEPYDFAGKLTTAMTAHPKIDPVTGEMHFFGYGFVPPYLTYHVAASDGTLRRSEEIALNGSFMIHDFAITDRDAIFWVLPVVFSLDDAIAAVSGASGKFPYRWDPSYGSKVGIIPLGGPASAVRWVDVDPCFVFHGTNAYRDGETIVVDVCRLPSAFKDGADLEPSALHRWTFDLAEQQVTWRDQQLSDVQQDLPGIDRRFVGRKHRYGWYAGFENDGPAGFEFTGINRFDHQTGAMDRWDPGPHYRAGEAVVVPRGAAEGDAWVVTFAYDRTRDASDFVVLDAMNMAAGPVGRVELPRRVPYGFHGWWVSSGTT